jgi:plastocyanin
MRRLILAVVLGLSVTMVALSRLPRLEAGGGGCHTPRSEAAADQVYIVDGCFGPTLAFVRPGTAVQWVNGDPMPHNVFGAGLAWGSGSAIDQGQTVAFHFDSEGIFPYFCSLHPSMVGVIVVGDPAGEPSDNVSEAVAKAPTRPTWQENSVVVFGPTFSPTRGAEPSVSRAERDSGDMTLSAIGGAGFLAGVVVTGGSMMLSRVARRKA